MGIVEAKNLVYEYIRRDEDGNVDSVNRALDGVSLDIEAGQFIAVLGGNGSGKSTFAKHINAILCPAEGTVLVDGKNTASPEYLWDIRESAGMIFQNPDNQIIGNIVEEDVGFGPENIGIPTEQIWERVEQALKRVGMYEYRKHSPNRLSGGQKQRVAIAGVMAMRPKCIIMDEPTAMLDPSGRREVIRAAWELNRKEHVTVILITHYMEEVIFADQVFVMENGSIAMRGTPREIFSRVEALRALRLDVPQPALLTYELQQKGISLPSGILTGKELVEALRDAGPEVSSPGAVKNKRTAGSASPGREAGSERLEDSLILDHVSYVYSRGTSDEVRALDDVSLVIRRGEFIGLIGHTGSGKSTLVQHLNGLIHPTSGKVWFHGRDISLKDYDRKELRFHVGLVFQYPEHQLFEETVFRDVCFGPKNMGLSEREAELRAFEALRSVKLPEDLYYASPFELSGGQKRRTAIAGVLAMKPEILVLDEPTAGLDPRGRDEILNLIRELHETEHISVILVSHSMEDVANYADRLLVMDCGRILMEGTAREVFSRHEELESIGLSAPEVTYIMEDLHRFFPDLDDSVTTIQEARDEILRIRKAGSC